MRLAVVGLGGATDPRSPPPWVLIGLCVAALAGAIGTYPYFALLASLASR